MAEPVAGAPPAPPVPPPGGRLAANVMHFARLLRAAGMPVGTDRVLLAQQALAVAAVASRADCRAALAACLLDRAEHRLLFDQAFELFWRDPELSARMQAMLLPKVQGKLAQRAGGDNRRLGEALAPPREQGAPPPASPPPGQALELRAELTWNERERLQRTDFETMSADEWRQARRVIQDLRPVFEPLPTRRTRRDARGTQPDWRGTLAAMARHGGELWDMRWRRRRERAAPLVLLADISGSMSRYSRMLLHFGHALANAPGGAVAGERARVESFVFGTRLTRITHALRARDPDLALSLVSASVPDWSGGTRIRDSLHLFNRRWARRVLPGHATLLLVTDGLEHGDPAALAFEMERLHKSCRRLIWLNPLLRYDRFEPRAGGIKAMLPHVDRFLPVHDLASLQALVALLAASTDRARPSPALSTPDAFNPQASPCS